jgi:sulfoacetaldehyde dehydrogenase
MIEDITNMNGRGHSCGIHTQQEERVVELAMRVNVSRVMVNQSQSLGNSGNFTNGMPFTLTLGCGSWGGNITSENITWKHFINTTWVSMPIEMNKPSDEEIFGDFWKKFGK